MTDATEQEPQAEPPVVFDTSQLLGEGRFTWCGARAESLPESCKGQTRNRVAMDYLDRAMEADEARRYWLTEEDEGDGLSRERLFYVLDDMARIGLTTFDEYISLMLHTAAKYLKRGAEAYAEGEPSVFYQLERWRRGPNVEARLELADTLSQGKIDEPMKALLRQEAASCASRRSSNA